MSTPTPKKLPIFYCPEQAIPREAVSGSPSAAKPEVVVQSWKKLGLPLEFRAFQPLTRDELTLAHAATYVDGVLGLTAPNGFGNFDARVAKSLPWTNGCFVAAAEHALRTGGVAVAPVSGFHHAEFADGGGFCTFNGLAIAAARLVKQGVRRLGILDCDAHFGNGTEDILDRVPGLRSRVLHYTRGSAHYRGGASEAPAFLAHLPVLLDEWKAAGVEIVLYQAGADPHVSDPVGCRFLTTEQLHARDTIVFQACARLGLPIAWDLAGGYQEDRARPWPQSIRPVLEIHDNTLRACAAAFLVPGRSRRSRPDEATTR